MVFIRLLLNKGGGGLGVLNFPICVFLALKIYFKRKLTKKVLNVSREEVGHWLRTES